MLASNQWLMIQFFGHPWPWSAATVLLVGQTSHPIFQENVSHFASFGCLQMLLPDWEFLHRSVTLGSSPLTGDDKHTLQSDHSQTTAIK